MKKILVFLIAITSFFIGLGYAEAFGSSLSTNKNNIGPGTNFELTVTTTGLSSTGLASADYTITYDTSKLTFNKSTIKYGQSKPAGDFLINESSPGTIKISYMDNQGGSNKLGNGTVLVLSFTTKSGASSGSSSFSLTGKGMSDSNATPLTSTFSGTSISYKVVSTNANLTALSLSNATISPTFSSSQLTYTATVASNVTSTSISATGAAGSTVTGNGTKTLKYGENTFSIVVTAEDGKTKKTYTIKVTRTDDRSNNKNLTSLTPSVGTINFKPATLNYNITIPANTSTFSVQAEADPKATITYSPSKSITLNPGETKTISIIVTAENTTKNTYKVNVTREDNRSNDKDLKSLNVSNTNIKYNKDTYTYRASVENNITSVNISTIANSDKAKLTGTGTKDLKVGENTFDIIVTAENKSIQKYTIIIIRADKNEPVIKISDNNNLSSLSIDGKFITLDKNNTAYNITTDKNNMLDIDYVTEDSKSTVIVNGNELNSSKIEIVVTAESGQTKIYTLNIERNIKNITTNKKNLNNLLYIIITIESLIIIVMASLLMKKKKNIQTNDINI
jgi:hypothetical protein